MKKSTLALFAIVILLTGLTACLKEKKADVKNAVPTTAPIESYSQNKTEPGVFNNASPEYSDTEIITETTSRNINEQPVDSNVLNLRDSFVGEWHRTNTVKACSGTITIKNQKDNSFDFSFFGYYGTNSGMIDATADITNKNIAELKYTPGNDKTTYANVEFELVENRLLVTLTDGNNNALGFGHNVFIEGEYIKSDPIYTDASIVDEIMPNDKIKERVRTLLGQDVYDQMIFVVEYGVRFQVDNLTYSGFLSGAGQGVDLHIVNDKIYCLGYGLDSNGLVYKFYTNDKDYHDKLPPFMPIDKPDNSLKIIYKEIE